MNLSGLWPRCNLHSKQGIPFSHRHWCQSVPSMHKTLSKRMVLLQIWEFGARSTSVSLSCSIMPMLTFHRNACPTGICFATLYHKARLFELMGIMLTSTAFYFRKAVQHITRLMIVVENIPIIQTAFSIRLSGYSIFKNSLAGSLARKPPVDCCKML